jgi:hypothetical protein
MWSHIQTLMKKGDTAEVVAHDTVVPSGQEQSWLSAFSDNDTSDDVSQELRMYRAMAKAPFGSDVLSWWKDHMGTFPRLARVARQYLGIPASSATVERIFSRAGSAMTNKRNRLGNDGFEAATAFGANFAFEAAANKKKRKRHDD